MINQSYNSSKNNMYLKIVQALLLSLIVIVAIGCKDEGIPEDLVDKKKYLATKKSELRELQKEIDEVTKQITELEPPVEKAPIPVKTQIIQAKEFKRYTEVEARVMAEDIVSVSSDMGGRIIRLNAKEGQYVNRGDLIAVTDTETIETQVSEIETSLSLAKTVYERQSRLWDQQIGSEIQLLQAKNNVERLEKSMETLQSQIKKKNLYAPISGVVDAEYLSQGEIASPGMPIVSILNTSKLKIVADLQESLLGSVKRGDKVDIYFPALDLNSTNNISLIGRSIDPANRTFKIEINTSSLKGKLKPNLLTLVKINDYSQKNVITIPLNIIKEEVSGQKYIYKVINKNGKKVAKKTPIEIGESSIDQVIVLSGIEPNDEIITTGGAGVSENIVVDTMQETTESNE